MIPLAISWPSFGIDHFTPLQVGLAAAMGVLAAMALVNARLRIELTLAAAAVVASLAAIS